MAKKKRIKKHPQQRASVQRLSNIAATPATAKLLREARERYERGEGPHPLESWAKNWNNQLGHLEGYADPPKLTDREETP